MTQVIHVITDDPFGAKQCSEGSVCTAPHPRLEQVRRGCQTRVEMGPRAGYGGCPFLPPKNRNTLFPMLTPDRGGGFSSWVFGREIRAVNLMVN